MIERFLYRLRARLKNRKSEDRRLLLALAGKLRFIIEGRAMASATMKLSASLAVAEALKLRGQV
jgi:hypothetical protein